MPLRTPIQTITVAREVVTSKDEKGKDIKQRVAVTPPLNEPFDFTDDEIAQIEAMNPNALSIMATVDLTAAPSPAAPSTPAAGKGKEDL